MVYENPEKKLNPRDYWKCPKCGQVVEIEFDTCWNCQEIRPIEIQNPSNDEILKYLSDDQSNLDTENYWKCPKCGEIFENDLDACWNCENVVSGQIKHPSLEEVVNYQSEKKPQSAIKAGFGLIGIGIVAMVFSGLSPISESLGFERIYYGRFIFGIFFIIIGIFALIVGFQKNK